MAGKNPDKSAFFGIQNYFIVDIDDTGVTYNYYGYVNRKGSVLIMQTNKATTAILYFLTTGTYSTIWAGRTGYTYVLPSALEDPEV